MLRSPSSFAIVLTAAMFAAACGGPPMPIHAPTVASAIAADKAPLVVDWPAGPRTDLETATHDGVAVVHVEPAKITLLQDCHIAGSYGFLGVSTKEQLIRLEDAGEIALSLPLRGAGLAADLSGELGTSTALDVALVTVGRRRTTRTAAPRSALRGSECAQATHFVRGFDVGAFVLTTAEKSQASTVAALFGAKGSYARKSGKSVHETDGDITACRSGKPGDAAPPAQCGAPLRLDLKAIDEDDNVESGSCGSGLVRAQGKCIERAKVRAKLAYECTPTNEEECREQCSAGSAQSCGHYAESLRQSTTKAPDFKAIAKIAEQGCTGGSERACVVLGELAQYGNGTAVDMKRASELYDHACAAGDALGCHRAGTLYDRRPGLPVDYAKANALYDRACRGGLADGCNNLGALYVAGHGTAAAPDRARGIYEEACKNGSATACGNLGELLADGIGGPKDVARAGELWNQACSKSGAHCIRLGDATSGAGPLPKDPMKSLDAYQRGTKILAAQCNLGMADRCDDLGWLFHDGHAVTRDDEQALTLIRKGCDLGSPVSCNHVAMFIERGWGVPANRAEAKAKFKQACDADNLHACVSFALLDDDRSARTKLLERACEGGVDAGCYHKARSERLASDGREGKARMEKACDDGYAPACAYLGRWNARDGASSDARKRLRFACDKGDLGGCAALAHELRFSDDQAAESLARRACAGGVAAACREVAMLAIDGRSKQTTASEVQSMLQKACEARDATACVTLATRVSQADPGRASSLLARACDVSTFSVDAFAKAITQQSVARAEPQVSVAHVGERLIEIGRHAGAGATAAGSSSGGQLEQDPMRSVAANAERISHVTKGGPDLKTIDLVDAGDIADDDPHAGCAALGEMHEKGLGFTADAAQAKSFYTIACTYGDGAGCTKLAALQERAKTKERELVRVLYARACDLSDGEGCLREGLIANGAAHPLERMGALASFVRACELGSGEGCMRTGNAEAAEHNDEAALGFFDKACNFKHEPGCKAANALRPRVEKAARNKPPVLRNGMPVGQVTIGTVDMTPSLDDGPRRVAAMRPRLRMCYQRGLAADPSMAGKVLLKARVDDKGAVSDAEVVTNSGLSADVANCMVSMVRKTQFAPASGAGATVIIAVIAAGR